nr:basic proline-rich protein-like [Dasypus novemcinctus]
MTSVVKCPQGAVPGGGGSGTEGGTCPARPSAGLRPLPAALPARSREQGPWSTGVHGVHGQSAAPAQHRPVRQGPWGSSPGATPPAGARPPSRDASLRRGREHSLAGPGPLKTRARPSGGTGSRSRRPRVGSLLPLSPPSQGLTPGASPCPLRLGAPESAPHTGRPGSARAAGIPRPQRTTHSAAPPRAPADPAPRRRSRVAQEQEPGSRPPLGGARAVRLRAEPGPGRAAAPPSRLAAEELQPRRHRSPGAAGPAPGPWAPHLLPSCCRVCPRGQQLHVRKPPPQSRGRGPVQGTVRRGGRGLAGSKAGNRPRDPAPRPMGAEAQGQGLTKSSGTGGDGPWMVDCERGANGGKALGCGKGVSRRAAPDTHAPGPQSRGAERRAEPGLVELGLGAAPRGCGGGVVQGGARDERTSPLTEGQKDEPGSPRRQPPTRSAWGCAGPPDFLALPAARPGTPAWHPARTGSPSQATGRPDPGQAVQVAEATPGTHRAQARGHMSAEPVPSQAIPQRHGQLWAPRTPSGRLPPPPGLTVLAQPTRPSGLFRAQAAARKPPCLEDPRPFHGGTGGSITAGAGSGAPQYPA